MEGVKGYILRNTTSAVIDLQNPAKLVEYAFLSSQATDACQEISDLFKLDITKTVVEGADVNVLCMIIGENRLNVFISVSFVSSNPSTPSGKGTSSKNFLLYKVE
jgi:hypothetical protein